MDLTTKYMGLELRTPLVPSASPLSRNLDDVKRLEDGGAAAIVMYSFFEEEMTLEQYELEHHTTAGTESFAESLSFFPNPRRVLTGPEGYLKHLAAATRAVDIPVIASLNGSTPGGWTKMAWQMQQAGADAIELNFYDIPTDFDMPAQEVEEKYVERVKAIKGSVEIPVAVKLSPFFSNMANVAKRIVDAGADGLVLFNRFYQPDIDLEELEVMPNLLLSTPQASRLPMRWIAILHARIEASLAATSGIHTPEDVAKMIMVGADVTMLCSTLLRHGFGRIRVLEEGLTEFMEEKEYKSVEEMRGCMSQAKCEDPSAFERAQYMHALTNYRPSDFQTGTT